MGNQDRKFVSRTIGISALVIAGLVIVLYVPYLSNERIFDDFGFFANHGVAEFAIRPMSLTPRTFPYFTVASIYVIFGTIEAQRIFALVLHAATGASLLLLLRKISSEGRYDTAAGGHRSLGCTAGQLLSLGIALGFVVHPIATYGAAYLIQRTTLFATLLTLISLNLYLDAMGRRNTRLAIGAGFAYAMAVFSKEHAIMAMPVALTITPLVVAGWREKWKTGLSYAAIAVPAMLWVVAVRMHLIGELYEPAAALTSVRLDGASLAVTHPWLFSIGLQCELFYRYLYLWLTGDISRMSIDMRVDFKHIASISDVLWHIGLFFLPLVLLSFRRVRALLGPATSAGIVYLVLMFLVELSSVRIQEPFVLYRAYLWAPGVALIVCGVLSKIKPPIAIGILVVVIPWFCYGTIDRLESMRNDESVWKDALLKLSDPTLPGAERIFFYHGGYLAQKGKADEALPYMDRVIQLQPNWHRGYVGRATALLQLDRPAEALVDAERAIPLAPQNATPRFIRALALEKLGRRSDEIEELRIAASMGHLPSQMKLQELGPGTGVASGAR